MYYATCRQRVCGQNKDNLCLHAARTLIWRSCAFNRGPMTMPVLDGPMTMPVLDGVKPMAITLPICGTSESLFWKRKKKHILLDSVETNLNIWRVRWPSPRQVPVQIPTSPRQVRDDRKTSRVRTRVRDRTQVLQPQIKQSRPFTEFYERQWGNLFVWHIEISWTSGAWWPYQNILWPWDNIALQ